MLNTQRRKSLINRLLHKIYQEVSLPVNNKSLFTGEAGRSLFKVIYCKHFNNHQFNEDVVTSLQDILEEYSSVKPKTLCDGVSGIHWLFNYLISKDYVDLGDADKIFENDRELETYALTLLDNYNYDFLYGAIGIAYYLINKDRCESMFFELLFKKLKKLTENKRNVIFEYDLIKGEPNDGIMNLGFAHGVVGILKFCLVCYTSNICAVSAKALSKEIICMIRKQINIDKSFSYYGSRTDLKDKINQTSRLAWCYGDLSIAYVFYNAGMIFNDDDLLTHSREIFDLTLKRKDYHHTLVNDAGLCHGSSGIAYIFFKMWKITKAKEFEQASNFWIDKTIEFASHNDTVSGFKKFLQPDNSLSVDGNLLLGTSGIGLILISFLTEDFSWDSCIMLDSNLV